MHTSSGVNLGIVGFFIWMGTLQGMLPWQQPLVCFFRVVISWQQLEHGWPCCFLFNRQWRNWPKWSIKCKESIWFTIFSTQPPLLGISPGSLPGCLYWNCRTKHAVLFSSKNFLVNALRPPSGNSRRSLHLSALLRWVGYNLLIKGKSTLHLNVTFFGDFVGDYK